MKHEYNKPVVKLIDYAYQEQVVANSSEGNQIDGLGTTICTFNYPGCAITYSSNPPCMVDVVD